jgi:hypothetical protein
MREGKERGEATRVRKHVMLQKGESWRDASYLLLRMENKKKANPSTFAETFVIISQH